jgi:ferritin-like metal-binding protein YciE
MNMPPQIETPRDLLVAQLGKLLTIEETLAKRILPKLVSDLADEELCKLVDEHLTETRVHVERVRAAFAALGEEPSSRPAVGLDGLRVERESTIDDIAPALRPAFDCAGSIGVERYEITAYEAAIGLADELEETAAAEELRKNLAEEEAALSKLQARLAELSSRSSTAVS